MCHSFPQTRALLIGSSHELKDCCNRLLCLFAPHRTAQEAGLRAEFRNDARGRILNRKTSVAIGCDVVRFHQVSQNRVQQGDTYLVNGCTIRIDNCSRDSSFGKWLCAILSGGQGC